MLKRNIESFFVENAGNTCYIDSLLVALFYPFSSIDTLLQKDIANFNAIYLQEYIKIHMIDNMRENKSVSSDSMEMIRNLCFNNGWMYEAITSIDDYMEQQDVNEFFIFLMNMFDNEMIKIKSNVMDSSNNKSVEQEEIIPFIPFSIPEGKTQISIKDLLHNNCFENTLHITNVPNIIAMSINRFTNEGTRNNINIDIQKKIKPFANRSMINNHEWIFHAAVCHKGETIKLGHYYTLLCINNKWYIFDDLNIPCVREVNMTDKEVTTEIRKDCVFIIYRFFG